MPPRRGTRNNGLKPGRMALAAFLIIAGLYLADGKKRPQVRKLHYCTPEFARSTFTFQDGLAQPLATAQVTNAHLEACAGLSDQEGCLGYHSQTPIPAVKPPRGTKKCLLDCNHVGDCFALTGMCRCPAGEQGGPVIAWMERHMVRASTVKTQPCGRKPFSDACFCRLGWSRVRSPEIAALLPHPTKMGIFDDGPTTNPSVRLPWRENSCGGGARHMCRRVRRRHKHVLLSIQHDVRAHPGPAGKPSR